MATASKMDYYKSLPRKRMGSGVILQNSKGEVLLLKPTYKDHWEIPGGVVEEHESPKETAEREVFEEIGLHIEIRSCLVIHYRSASEDRDESIMFVFDAGVLVDGVELTLEEKEIAEAKFVSFQDAMVMTGKYIATRFPFCEQALKEKRTIYLESIGKLEATFVS